VHNTRVEHHSGEDLAHSVVIDVASPRGLLRSPATWNGSVTVRVELPEGADIDVSSRAGDISADGAFGHARLASASGDVAVTSVGGDLHANTASGEIRAGSVRGKAEVSTASGTVGCELLHGPTRLRTASGDITIKAARAHVSAQTAYGDVRIAELRDGCQLQAASGDLEVERAVSGRAKLQTMNGDVTVGVPRGTAVAVDAQSLTGELSSEIDLDAERPPRESEGPGGPADQAGDRWLELNARTVCQATYS
jgi:DUF4097 and DUF4098 domain-containing protein YvlB